MTEEGSPVELSEFIAEQNQNLEKTGTERSEQSFGLGCALGMVPIFVMIAILWVAGVLNLISAFMVLIMGGLALVGIAGLVSSAAKKRAIKNTYQYHVKLEIDRYLRETGVQRSEFDARAAQILTEDAPLRSYIEPPPPNPAPQE